MCDLRNIYTWYQYVDLGFGTAIQTHLSFAVGISSMRQTYGLMRLSRDNDGLGSIMLYCSLTALFMSARATTHRLYNKARTLSTIVLVGGCHFKLCVSFVGSWICTVYIPYISCIHTMYMQVCLDKPDWLRSRSVRLMEFPAYAKCRVQVEFRRVLRLNVDTGQNRELAPKTEHKDE